MFNLASHLIRCAGLALSRRAQSSSQSASGDHCCVCGDAAVQRTRCCQTLLCAYHAAAWASDPHPCSCGRR